MPRLPLHQLVTASFASPPPPTGTPLPCVCAVSVCTVCLTSDTHVCSQIIYKNDMSMGNSTSKKTGGSHASSITPNPEGHGQSRLVLADAFILALSAYSTSGPLRVR